MAANMKAVKLRIKSVESTMQITKAMELVASSKLRRAKERVEKVEDVVNVGDEIVVKLVEIDAKGRMNLSRNAALQSH